MNSKHVIKSGLALLLSISLLCGSAMTAMAVEEVQPEEQPVQDVLTEDERNEEIQPDEESIQEILSDNTQVQEIEPTEDRIEELQTELALLTKDDAIIDNQLIVVTKDSESLEESVAQAEEDVIVQTLETEEETIATVETQDELAVKIAEYEADPNIEHVQPNYIYSIQDDVNEYQLIDEASVGDEITTMATVNDPFLSEQWYLSGSTSITGAWDYAKTQKKVKVAVIDSGVQANHPDLKANISSKSYDIVRKTSTMTDTNGHGTHVAGIIAAVANNGVGVAGVSYNAELLCYRVTQMINGKEGTSTDVVIQAYVRAINDGAQVVNMSLGGYSNDTLLRSAIETGLQHGVVTVCAAGNDNTSMPCYPADYDACISVVATDSNNNRASFSNYNQYKDIAAPGVSILSTYPQNAYAFSNGTSMASPVVAGVVSLILAIDPTLSVNQVKNILYSTATDLGASGKDNYYGHGLVNARAALEKITEQPDTSKGINYSTHIQGIGWQVKKANGTTSGTTGQSKRLEAIRISLSKPDATGSVEYQTHIQGIGWQDWKKDDAISGTSGQSKRLEAIRIRLTGNMEKKYDVYYRVHAQQFGWMGWAKNGAMAGTAGYSYRLEAIEIVLIAKGGKAPGSTSNTFRQKNLVKYQTHVQTFGWQGLKYDGATSGTSGQSKRLEGIKISLVSPQYKGNIEYQTHIQTIGWQGWKKNDALSGTTGQSKRLEGIRIRLTDEMAQKYDIYYRVHAQNFGWMGWAKNGASAGTAGYSYRLEGIQIKLVAKGGAAPGSTSNAFRSK